jgi:hypothetical protein
MLEGLTDGEPEKSVPIGNSRLIFCVAFISRTDVQEHRKTPLGTHRFRLPCFDQRSKGEPGPLEAMRIQGVLQLKASIINPPQVGQPTVSRSQNGRRHPLFIGHLSFVIAGRSSRSIPYEHWAISGQ